jgi:glucose-6-phosphate 1-epimerase
MRDRRTATDMQDKLPSGVTRMQDPGGREALQLAGEGGTVVVAMLGAQVLSWRAPDGDVLWTASKAAYESGKPVRGGVPLVFPWFGDHPTDGKLPAHGFVRNREWQLVHANEGPEVVLETASDDATLAMWPHAFRLRLSVSLSTSLRLMLMVENTGERPFPFEAALHTYFGTGDVEKATVHGLEGVAYTESAAAPETSWDPKKPLAFRAETDRIFQGVPAELELRAPALSRVVTLTTRDAKSAIVWNPWPAKTAKLSQMAADDWRTFCCIETANVRENAVKLGPGEVHRMSLSIACKPA